MNALINIALANFSIYMAIASVEKLMALISAQKTKRQMMNFVQNIFNKEDK